ncbi:tRNA synthetases class II (A)-domain-containing protein [Aspergillus multicolor]|uniref:tRNA synthetases class II (A)-domain-containing protein n=1 Tax=Aspergillus multicolor TaxID=41759 RepID=UPI003CCCFD0B
MSLHADKWPAMAVRNTFLNLFKDKGHAYVSFSSYKSISLGTVEPNVDFAQLKRATNSQKCIRAGGKHNDLDDVGKDNYHHTFFEMLGNWTFGDYFKQTAIEYSWEILTRVFGIDPTRLYITYFEGHPALGLDPDIETKEIWRGIGVADDHIVPGNMKDNFWEMGSQGPCGPFNQTDPEVVEIWNVVFIKFNMELDMTLRILPNKHIDTGLGFERLVSALQNKTSNYDTDIFTPLFEKVQEITGARPYLGKFGAEDDDGIDTAYRVVADHARTCTVAITDGAIVPTVVDQIGDTCPEVREKEHFVKEILDDEEQPFTVTLDRGEAMFSKYAQKCHDSGSKDLPGAHVWRLYDTYGFPIDLTKLMAEEQGLRINENEVSVAQEKARAASKGDKKSASNLITLTDDREKYAKGSIQSTVQALYYNHEFIKSTSEVFPNGAQFGVVLDKTNFYAEAGGQIFDTGRLTINGVADFSVGDVQSYGGYILHTGYMKYGNLNVGDTVVSEYYEKGSLVAPEKLRFDFSRKTGITEPELERIQMISDKYIQDDQEVFASNASLDIARQIQRVRAVAGETYPDPTRVVSIGVPVSTLVGNVSSEDRWNYSIEFCGGTHVAGTGEIKDMVNLEESGIAKGVRRIVAVTSQGAQEARQNAVRLGERLVRLEKKKEALVKEAQNELATSPISILDKKVLGRRLDQVTNEMNPSSTLFVVHLPGSECSAKVISEAIKQASSRHSDKSTYFTGLYGASDRIVHGCFVAKADASGNNLVANEWVAEISENVGGKAGGKGATSIGSGPETANLEDGIEAASTYLRDLNI